MPDTAATEGLFQELSVLVSSGEYTLYGLETYGRPSAKVTQVYLFVSYDGRIKNVSETIAEAMGYSFNPEENCILWSYKESKQDSMTFNPAMFITGRLADELYGSRSSIAYQDLKKP